MNRVPASFAGTSPLDRTGPADARASALRDYVEHRTRPWDGVPMRLPGGVTAALWSLVATNAGLGVWLVLVLRGAATCEGPACTIATWGHPVPLLVLAGSCVVVMAAGAVVTRGLTETGAVALCAVLMGAAAGVVAISGLVALVLIAMAGLALVAAVLVAVATRL